MGFNRVINKFPTRRRPIVLLEVLLALALVILLVLPWVGTPAKLYRLEMEQLERLERQRTADWIVSEIKEALYNKEIPWENLPKEKSPTTLPKKEVTIRVGGRSRTLECTCKLRCVGERITKQSTLHRLIEIQLTFSPKLKKDSKYSYLTIVRKLP